MRKGFLKKVKKIGKGIAAGGAVVAATATNAMATPWIDVSGIAVDTASVSTLGLTILTGLASIWGLRKLVKTINHS